MREVKILEDLPPAFSVDQFAKIFGISRKLAFKVAKAENLAIRIGEKRLVCLRDRVVAWANKQ